MIEIGTIAILTEEGAKEVMARWHSGHPFHELAKWLTEHPDAKLLIKNKTREYCEITLEPETLQKYEQEIREKHLSIHLANWIEHWFKPIRQLQLPEPKYHVGEEVFVKDCGKYHKAQIEKIEPIWNIESCYSPCTFKTWGYRVVGHGAYPFPENEITPKLQYEKAQEEQTTVFTPIIMKPEDKFDDVSNKLYSEGWRVNSAEYMQADTPEEAVELQAKTFPSQEFQPVKLPNGKWVAFHRKPIPHHPNYTSDIPEYENNYVCPICGEKVAWNGGSYFKDFDCVKGHKIDRNSLVKKEDYKPTVGLTLEQRFQKRIIRVDLVATDRNLIGLTYTPIQYTTEAQAESLINEARTRGEHPIALSITFEDGNQYWLNNLSTPLLDKWKFWSIGKPTLVEHIEKKLQKQMKEIIETQKTETVETEAEAEAETENLEKTEKTRSTQKSLFDYIKQN